MTIIYPRPPGPGWTPITLMARLAAELFEAKLVEFSVSDIRNRMRAPLGILPRRRAPGGHCLVIASRPAYLLATLRAGHWLRGFEHVSAWVIDSFWTERIPQAPFRSSHLDQLFVTDGELLDEWVATTGVRTAWLPIGSNVLDHGSRKGDRPVDLQRVGRQPADWEDDAVVRAACEMAGLVYRGRPGMDADPIRNQENLRSAVTAAKFTLSFTNRVSPAPYTHPTREYLTARWTDALAMGATVAGISPTSVSTTSLLWPTALLELKDTSLDNGLNTIAEAVRAWTPQRARENYLRALERLDLRWRLASISNIIGFESAVLHREVGRLQAELSELRSESLGTERP